MSSAILFRVMVPFLPEKVPNLSGKNIFIGAGQYDPIVPLEQTETLVGLFKKAGANVVVHIQENSGHELGYDEISAAKDWLSNIHKNSS
jgi:phospholipase/carboxylesterase